MNCVDSCPENMEFDEGMMRCKCPATHYFYAPPEEEWEAGTMPTGECVEIPPCGEGRVYMNINWMPMCVTPMVEADCPVGTTYKGDTNECVFVNTCVVG